MATRYKATIEFECWKQHECAACGSAYRYRFRRKKTGQGGSKDAAAKAANRAIVRSVENEVDQQPCPTCGLYQPDMIGSRRAAAHWWLFAAAAAAVVLTMLLVAGEAILINVGAWLLAIVGLVVVVINALIDRHNLNANRAANRDLAQARVTSQILELLTTGTREEPPPITNLSRWTTPQCLAFFLMTAAVVVFPVCELLRLGRGWPLNPAWYPPVAGAADQPYIYFPEKVQSVKGYWTGTALAEVANWQELGLGSARLTADTRQANWGESISVKSSEKNSNSSLWVRVQVPPTPDLAGKTMKVQMKLAVSFPAMSGGNNYENKSAAYSHTADIKLASPGAGAEYKSLWWTGSLGGGTLLLATNVWLAFLAGGLRNLALPTKVTAIDQPNPETPPSG
jgi:hypothetical protein